MSARRVGFGDEDEKPAKPRVPTEDGPAENADAPDAQEMSRFGKLILSAFLIAWLVGWSIGLFEMAGNMPAFYARGDWFSLVD